MKSERDNYSDQSNEDDRDRDRRGRRDRQSRFSRSGSMERDRSPRRKKTNRVFISNIPYEYRWQELKDLFREQVGEVSFVELFVDETDKPRGSGIIEFPTAELANIAVDKMHRYELKGRKLVVKEDNDVERDKYGRPRGGGGSGGGGRRDNDRNDKASSWNDLPSLVGGNAGNATQNTAKWGNTYGLSSQFLESLNISGPLVPRCFVANLDYKVDDKKLKEVFRLAGRVLSAEISIDKEGKSRGFGVVEFEHPVEAVQAISMLHHQMLFDRRLSVRMDRIDKGDGLPAKLPEGLKGIGMGLGENGVPLHDVARNLPQVQTPQAPAPVPSLSLANNALATAALVNNLIGSAGGADISSLAAASPFNAALSSANPLAAHLLGSAATAGGLNAFNSARNQSSGGDFDSLSAALSGGGGGVASGGLPSRGLSTTPSSRPSDSIIINNLPPGMTWQLLREKCRDAGDVKFAEMRGKDTGIVQFSSQWDAQRAISMLDGIRVDGRTIDVRFY